MGMGTWYRTVYGARVYRRGIWYCLTPTDTSVRSGVTAMYVTAVAAGQSQRFYSGIRMSTGRYLSSPPQIPRRSRFPLESKGLKCPFGSNGYVTAMAVGQR